MHYQIKLIFNARISRTGLVRYLSPSFAKQSVYPIPRLNLLLTRHPEEGKSGFLRPLPAPRAAHCLANGILEPSQSCSLYMRFGLVLFLRITYILAKMADRR